MGLAQYQILSQGDEWGVLHDGDVRNRYATKEAAFEAAVAAASLAIREGHEVISVCLIAQAEPDGSWREGSRPVSRHGNDVVLFGAVGYKLERVIGERTLQRPGFILRRPSIHRALHGPSG